MKKVFKCQRKKPRRIKTKKKKEVIEGQQSRNSMREKREKSKFKIRYSSISCLSVLKEVAEK